MLTMVRQLFNSRALKNVGSNVVQKLRSITKDEFLHFYGAIAKLLFGGSFAYVISFECYTKCFLFRLLAW